MQQLATDVANIIKTEHEKKKAEKKEAWDKFKVEWDEFHVKFIWWFLGKCIRNNA